MELNLQNPENIRILRKQIFPYYMLNHGFLRMIDSLIATSRHHGKEVNNICHQLAKDFNLNKDSKGNVIWEGWNVVFQQKLRKRGIDGNQSLLILRYLEYDIQMAFNMIFLISSGRYHLAIREMRFVLESFVHAFCIDKIYESLSLKEKLEELKKMEKTIDPRFRYKERLFTETFTKYAKTKNLGEEMYKFYQELCGKVHPSYEELSHLIKTMEELGEEFVMGGCYSFYDEDNLVESLNNFFWLHMSLINILKSF